jgi:hypothetical protein
VLILYEVEWAKITAIIPPLKEGNLVLDKLFVSSPNRPAKSGKKKENCLIFYSYFDNNI